MSEPFIAEIILFGGNFAPRGWAFCSGQLLPINQNTALFSLLGTTYGGDGRTTFGLPDCRGRYARGSEGNSAGPGLTVVRLGEKGGAVNHTLTTGQMPSHNHTLPNNAVEDSPNQTDPAGHSFAEDGSYHDGTAGARTQPTATANAGNSQAFGILDPYIGLNYIIALVGVFPSRN